MKLPAKPASVARNKSFVGRVIITVVLALFSVTLHAADPGLEHSALDAGGGRMGGAGLYMNVGFTSIGALSSSLDLSVEDRSGFIGQLNDPPVMADDLVGRAANSPVEIPVGIMLGNDFDVDGDFLSFSLPQNLSQLNANIDLVVGAVQYTPSNGAGSNQVDSFPYRLSDGIHSEQEANVSVEVSYGVHHGANVTDPLMISGLTGIDFGSAAVGGAAVAQTFTVANLSNRNLEFLGNPVISGPGSSAFGLVSPPGLLTLTPGDFTSFTIEFSPSAHGSYNASVAFEFVGNVDVGFSFTVLGEGLSVLTWDVPEGVADVHLQINGTDTELVDGLGNVLESVDPTTIGQLVINAPSSGTDLTTNFDPNDPLPSGGLVFQGAGGADTLSLSGGSFQDITYRFDTETSGEIDFDGALIAYADLEEINDQSTTLRRHLNYNGGDEAIVLNSTGSQTSVDSTVGVQVHFDTPTDALNLNAGIGADSVVVDGFGADFDVDFTVFGGGGDDQIELNQTGAGLPTHISITGNEGDDTIEIDYSLAAGSPITVDGSDHTQGDLLRFDTQGVATNVDGVQLTAPGMNPVNYSAIEFIELITKPIIVVHNGPDTSAPVLENGISDVVFDAISCGETVIESFTIANNGNAVLSPANLVLPNGFTLNGTFPDSIAPGEMATFQISLEGVTLGNIGGPIHFEHNDELETPFSFTLTGNVEDTVLPDAVAQDLTVQLDAQGTALITVEQIDAGSADNCGIANISLDTTSFTCADIGPNPVTLTVTDTSGNVSSATATVTVEDNLPPVVAILNGLTVELDATGSASITAADLNDGSADNCGIADLSLDVTNFTCANIGPNTVTLTVTDTSGNVSSANTIVTVEDNLAPTVAIHSELTVELDGAGSVSVTAADLDDGSSDNCDIADLSLDLTSFTCANIGPNTVTLTVTDTSGNVSSANATVIVEDNLAPTIAILSELTVELDATGSVSITVADLNDGSSDNCGIADLNLDVTNFTCANIGPNTVTLTVTDTSGNVSSASSTVIVEDNLAPTIAILSELTVELDATGSVSITVADLDDGSSDNCGIADLSLDVTSFTCANIGPNTVTLTVTDTSGNVSSASSIVMVEDNLAPTVAILSELTVELDATGSVSITADDLDDGSTDNCGIADLSLDVMSFTCANIGPNTVTLTVTDTSGNVSSSSATVTVEDNLAPVVAILNELTVELDANGSASITASDLDDGSSDNCGIVNLSLDVTNFTCANIGPNTVTLTLTDMNGNTSTANASVMVEDNLPPTLAVLSQLTVELDAFGTASITVADVDNGSSDNCGITNLSLDRTTFSCADVGEVDVTFSATDTSGLVSTASVLVSVLDVTPPALVLNGPAEMTLSIGDTYIELDAVALDECDPGVIAIIGGDVVDTNQVGTYFVTYDAIDVSGNAAIQLVRTVQVISAFTIQDALVGYEKIDMDTRSKVTGDLLSQKRIIHGTRTVVSGASRNVTGDIDLRNSAEVLGEIEAGGSITLNNSATAGASVHSGDDIELKTQSEITGDAVASGEVSVHRTASVGGSITENAPAPMIPDLVLPDLGLSTIRRDIQIARNQILSLAPGEYGTLNMKANATLQLGSGTYTFEKIDAGNNAAITASVSSGDLVLNILGNINVKQGFDLLPSDMPVENGALNILVQSTGSRVDVGRQSHVAGTILAPAAVIDVDQRSNVSGALYGKKVVLGYRSEFSALPAENLVRSISLDWLGMTSDCNSMTQMNPVSEPLLALLFEHAIYGCERVTLGRSSVVNGNVGSQTRIDVGMRSQVLGNATTVLGNLNLSRLAHISGNAVSGGRLELAIQAGINGNVFSGGNVKLNAFSRVMGNITSEGNVQVHRWASVDGNINENTSIPPIQSFSRPVFEFTLQGQDIDVSQGDTLSIVPGIYGNLRLRQNATIHMVAGDYLFNSIDLGNRAVMDMHLGNEDVIVSVIESFDSDTRSEIRATGTGPDSVANNVLFQVQGSGVQLGQGGTFLGTFVAPHAQVHLRSDATLTGAILAKSIQLGAQSEVFVDAAIELMQSQASSWTELSSSSGGSGGNSNDDDNGDNDDEEDDEEDDDRNRRSFRSYFIQQPLVQIIGMRDGSPVLRVFAINGFAYVLQYSDLPQDGNWQTLAELSGEKEFIDDSNTEHSMRFYRVLPKPLDEWEDLPSSSVN